MYSLNWGEPGLGRNLTEDEISNLRKRLTKDASNSRVFHIQLLPAEIRWIANNITNSHLERVTSDTADGRVWCILGADKESVMHEYCKI